MKISGISEADNPFTMMGLLTVIIEDITRLEEQIDLLHMNQFLLHSYLRKLLNELARAAQKN
jgi:hypothetical protein